MKAESSWGPRGPSLRRWHFPSVQMCHYLYHMPSCKASVVTDWMRRWRGNGVRTSKIATNFFMAPIHRSPRLYWAADCLLVQIAALLQRFTLTALLTMLSAGAAGAVLSEDALKSHTAHPAENQTTGRALATHWAFSSYRQRGISFWICSTEKDYVFKKETDFVLLTLIRFLQMSLSGC